VLPRSTLRNLLSPFELSLSSTQEDLILTYLGSLLKWGRKINLTTVLDPEECVTRHFGESLYLSRLLRLEGSLLDIGSGAGFPGLALKIVVPDLAVTLLEPVAKKRAFLKEVARVCGFDRVDVKADRLEYYCSLLDRPLHDFATARAVGQVPGLANDALHCLSDGGRLCFWLGVDQFTGLGQATPGIAWEEPVPIPLSRNRLICIGRKLNSQENRPKKSG
jgi:16S rRNA (guanine527-N7)-methyltransferase